MEFDGPERKYGGMYEGMKEDGSSLAFATGRTDEPPGVVAVTLLGPQSWKAKLQQRGISFHLAYFIICPRLCLTLSCF